MAGTKTKSHQIDMCNGPIISKMLMFAIPLMLSNILQLLFNAADVIVVGKFAGEDALAAVGSTGSLVNLFVNFFMGLSVGANVLVGRFLGAKQEQKVKETVHTSIMTSLICGVFLLVFGIIFSPIVLKWMDSPPEVLPLAVLYLRIYFLGIPALMLYNFGAAILRAMGDTKRPLSYLTLSGILNVCLNLLTVVGFKWSVAGVAIATICSQYVSAILILRCLMKEQSVIRVELKHLKIHWDKLRKILQVGIPTGLQSVMFALSNVLIQSSVNSFGATVVAGGAAAGNIEGFAYTAMNAFYQANLSFTSQNYGAGKYKRIDKILVRGVICAACVGILTGGACYLFGPQLLSLYTDSAEVIAAGMVKLSIVALPYFLCGIMESIVGSLRGMGYTVFPMLVTLAGSCLLRIVWLQTVFRIEQFHTIETIYIIYPISWIVTEIAHLITFLVVRKKVYRF